MSVSAGVRMRHPAARRRPGRAPAPGIEGVERRRSRGCAGRPRSARRSSRDRVADAVSSATPTCARTQAARPGRRCPPTRSAAVESARAAGEREQQRASDRAASVAVTTSAPPRSTRRATSSTSAHVAGARRRGPRRRRRRSCPGSGQSASASSRSTASPSMSKWGSTRSSHRGIHHAFSPSSAMTAGDSVMRTRKASITMPTARPSAIGLSEASPSGTNAANTANMMRAAAVTTRADDGEAGLDRRPARPRGLRRGSTPRLRAWT